jgi:hypothetical protein
MTDEEFEKHCSWYEKNLKVVDRTGKVVPFQLYPVQKHLERLVCESMEAREPCFVVVLKARREGVSTWVAARFYRDSKEMEHRRSMILAHDDKATKNVLDMTRFFFQNDPDKPETEKDSQAILKFKDNKSEFMVYTAGSRGKAGRSFNAQAIHISEIDFWDDPRTFTSVMQVTPNTYPTVVIVESTAQGPDGPMQRLWDPAVEGRNGFTPVFFAWFDFEEYRRPLCWDDLSSFADRTWVAKNRNFLNVAVAKKKNAVAENRNYWRKRRRKEEAENGLGQAPGPDGGPDEDRPGTTLPGDPGSGGETAQAGGEGVPGDEVQDAGGEVEGEGTGRRGRVPAQPLGWQALIRTGNAATWGTPPAFTGKRRKGARARLAERAKKHGIYKHRDDRILKKAFEDSLTPYELSLIAEFGAEKISYEAINWLRWVRAVKCNGDDIERRREYPSRPEESFEAAAESVLDPVVIAYWAKWAAENPPETIRFEITEDPFGRVRASALLDGTGHVQVWEHPVPEAQYVMGVDPSTGSKDGDWTIATVLSVEDGSQVAEFRARMDPDLAIDQIEALGVYYNAAFTGVEANSYGIPYVRALEDRGTLPMFEREIPDRREPGKTNKLAGWLTTPKSRNLLFTELRKAVRENRCQIRSVQSLRECRTLTIVRTDVSRLERIEARSGCHDDGPMAHGIAILMRNRVLPTEAAERENDRKDEPVPKLVQALLDEFQERDRGGRLPLTPRHTQVSGIALRIDGRRSVL